MNEDVLHENIRGILVAETSGLASREFVSVLPQIVQQAQKAKASATSGDYPTLWVLSVQSGVMLELAARDSKEKRENLSDGGNC